MLQGMWAGWLDYQSDNSEIPLRGLTCCTANCVTSVPYMLSVFAMKIGIS